MKLNNKVKYNYESVCHWLSQKCPVLQKAFLVLIHYLRRANGGFFVEGLGTGKVAAVRLGSQV